MSDPFFTTVSLVVSFLGGGVVSAIINRLYIARSEKRERKIKFLDDQLRKLYGPLYYFVSQTEKCFELHRNVLKAMDVFFQQKWSNDDKTTQELKSGAEKSLDIVAQYIKEVIFNNQKIKEILDNNYSYIDHDDIDVFLLFIEHYLRSNTETEKGALIVPQEVYKKIGNISLICPEFVEKVKSKFKNKKEELDGLLNK